MPTVAKTADGTSVAAAGGAPTAWAWGRVGLLAAGVALVVVYIVLLVAHTTTTVTERDAAGRIVRTTDTTALYPEATSSVVIGAAVLLLIVATLYSRITKITGPGGIAVEFSGDEKERASAAVSDVVKRQPSDLKEKATSPGTMSTGEAEDAARALAGRAGDGTIQVLQRARDIVKTAGSSPSEALKLAEASGVSRNAAASFVFQGRTSDDFWSSLAEGMLTARPPAHPTA